MVKILPVMPETWVQSLGWEDSLEEGIATHYSILAWRIPTDQQAWEDAVHGVAKSQTKLSDFASLQEFFICYSVLDNLEPSYGHQRLRFTVIQRSFHGFIDSRELSDLY